MSRILLVFMSVTLIFGCGDRRKQYELSKGLREGFPPQILAYHADRSIRPGTTWRIYLRLNDLDCDITYIVADLYQSGVGQYAPSYTPIKEVGCKEIQGYLSLSTPADQALIQDQVELRIILRDRRGNRSQPIKLFLSFDWHSSQKPPEHWQAAASNHLGSIQIDLASSQSFQGRGS